MKRIYEDVLRKIPDYKEFLTVEELDESSKKLHEQYSDIVDLYEIGHTGNNHPLYCLKIGCGSKNALMFGCPHPNEPIGTMMLEFFTRELAENKELRDELDYTWYIVKSWDADGTKLNEKWFKEPYTLYNYSRNFFRPAGHKQVDWTFPIEYKNLYFKDTLPETEAMMGLIDDIKPKFIYSLHNAGFGGVYWYISKNIHEIFDDMKNAAKKQGVPLNLGEPESHSCVAFDSAIYQEMGVRQAYDYLERYGVANPEKIIKSGSCSAEYAKDRYDSFTLLTELPYFYDERINNLSLSNITRKEAVLIGLKHDEEFDSFIKTSLNFMKNYVDENNPFKLALESFSNNSESKEATIKMIDSNLDYSRIATVAEKFDNLVIKKFYKMLSCGMLVRLAETELENMDKAAENNLEKRKVLEEAFKSSEKELKLLSNKLEEELNYEVVPIRKLVNIQLECGLLVADYLNQNKV